MLAHGILRACLSNVTNLYNGVGMVDLRALNSPLSASLNAHLAADVEYVAAGRYRALEAGRKGAIDRTRKNTILVPACVRKLLQVQNS